MIVAPLHYFDILNDQAAEAASAGAVERAAALRAGAEALEAEDVRQRNLRYPDSPTGYHDDTGSRAITGLADGRATIGVIDVQESRDSYGDAHGRETPSASWAPVDLGPALNGQTRRLEPTVLVCEDCRALFYAGSVNGLHADSGIGKSWVVAIGIAQELRAGHHVIVIDLEDDESTIVGRLRDDLGVGADLILECLHYHRPTEPFDDAAVDLIEAEAREHAVTLIVIDSLGEAFGLEGVDENKDVEVGPWLRRVARRLADTGAAVVVVDHATKAADNPLHPSGSKRKRAAITGASYLVEAPRPLTREDGGRLRLLVAKDRHGHRRRGAEACSIDFAVYPDGGMTVHLWPPTAASQREDTPEGKLLVLARTAVRAAKDAGRPLSTNALIELMSVRARVTAKRAAIEEAVALGALRAQDGPRRSVLHVWVCDLTDDQDPES